MLLCAILSLFLVTFLAGICSSQENSTTSQILSSVHQSGATDIILTSASSAVGAKNETNLGSTAKNSINNNGNQTTARSVTTPTSHDAVTKAATGAGNGGQAPPPPSMDIWHTGLYGIDCERQILVWMYDNYDYSFTESEIKCACRAQCAGTVFTAAPGVAEGFAQWALGALARASVKALNHYVVLVAFTSAVVLLGIVGNVATFVCILRWLPASITNTMLASQCVADLIVVTLSPTLQIVKLIMPRWNMLPVGCSMINLLRDVSFMASSLSLAVLGIERFIAICYPLQAKSICTFKQTYIALAIIWTSSIGLGVWRGFNVEFVGQVCWSVPAPPTPESITFFGVRWIGILCIPLLLLIFCYSRVIVTLYASLDRVRQLKHSSQTVPKHTKESAKEKTAEEREVTTRLKVIRLLIIVVVTFAVCWGPVITVETAVGVLGASLPGEQSESLSKAFLFLSYFNSAANPVLYGIFLQSFRVCYKKILTCQVCRKSRQELRAAAYLASGDHHQPAVVTASRVKISTGTGGVSSTSNNGAAHVKLSAGASASSGSLPLSPASISLDSLAASLDSVPRSPIPTSLDSQPPAPVAASVGSLTLAPSAELDAVLSTDFSQDAIERL